MFQDTKGGKELRRFDWGGQTFQHSWNRARADRSSKIIKNLLKYNFCASINWLHFYNLIVKLVIELSDIMSRTANIKAILGKWIKKVIKFQNEHYLLLGDPELRVKAIKPSGDCFYEVLESE